MNIVGIVCINKSNYSIGHNNQLLYALKNDMRFFKHTTTTTTDLDKQNAVLMGYNTYTSIPAQYFPLQNRINIIISNRHYKEIKQKIKVESLENVYVFRNILNGIHFCNVMNTIETLFVIGGSSIYDYFIKNYLFNNIYITEITKPITDIGTVYLDNIQILELNYIKHYVQTSTDNNSKCHVDNQRYTVTYSIYNYKAIFVETYHKYIAERTNEHNYLDTLHYVLEHGENRNTRNSETISTFGTRMEFDLTLGFPLLTTKKMFWKGIKEELVWFLQGNTNSKDLSDKGVHIWDGNSNRDFLDSIGLETYKEWDCGPIYGFQWRHFNARYRGCNATYYNQGVDQLLHVIHLLKTDPTSRRIFMSAWNPEQMKQMALPPCHISYQFYVADGNKLQCQMYQRSGDMFLGVPFNIASTALLVHIIAKMTDLVPGKIIIVVGDAHIYKNHIEQVKLQLQRKPYVPCSLMIKTKKKNIEDYISSDFVLKNYSSQSSIKGDMVA
jgi:dihydrofolate reductase / thymidylate synthase